MLVYLLQGFLMYGYEGFFAIEVDAAKDLVGLFYDFEYLANISAIIDDVKAKERI